VIDAVVQPEDLREEIARRFALSAGKQRDWPPKHNPITPV
jgi:acetyl-CoA carboxylase carboxyltransferase component